MEKFIKPLGEWNTYRIVAKGKVIKQYLNGVLMSETVDNATKKVNIKGSIALQIHKTEDVGMKVQFKNITIKEL